MKHLLPILILFFVAQPGRSASSLIPYGWGDRILPFTGMPIGKIAMSDGVAWEFSWTEAASDVAAYKIYGDTLLTEIAAERRQWYSLRGDTALFVREETTLMKVVPDSAAAVAAFGKYTTPDVEVRLNASGTYSGEMTLAETGTIESSAPVRGTLIIGNDTLTAWLTRERRCFHPSLGNVGVDSLTGYTIDRYRWYRPSDPLPVALQCDVAITRKGVTDRSSSVFIADFHAPETYALSRSRIRSECRLNGYGHEPPSGGESHAQFSSPSEIADMLTETTVTVDGGEIRIVFSPGLSDMPGLSVDVMDAGGILYRHVGVTESPLPPIDVSSLQPGRYVVAISVGDIVEKRIIHL